MSMCDEVEVLLTNAETSVRSHRALPYSCLVSLAVIGIAGHICWRTFPDRTTASWDVSSLYSLPWHPAWRDRVSRLDESGCTWDGDDCRRSRCCAREGSRCFMKNGHWASCNETCHPYTKWEAGVDNRGHWVATYSPVWQCVDLSVPRATSATTAPPPLTSVVEVEVPPSAAPSAAPSTSLPPAYSVFDTKSDSVQSDYGDRISRTSASSPITQAHVSWEDLQ